MRNLPGSRTCSKAALLSRAQLPETEVTSTVVDLLLSRLVTFSFVPAGNWLLDAAGAPASPESVTVEPGHTTSPAGAAAAGSPEPAWSRFFCRRGAWALPGALPELPGAAAWPLPATTFAAQPATCRRC